MPVTRRRVSTGGRGERPAKYMLYSASSRLISISRALSSRSTPVDSAISGASRNQTSGSHSSRACGTGRPSIEHLARVEPADDRKQIAQRFGIGRVERRTVPCLLGLSHEPVVARRPRQFHGPGVLVAGKRRKDQRDGERPGRRAKQRRVQVGVERRQFLGARLLGRARRTARTARAAGWPERRRLAGNGWLDLEGGCDIDP